uniref:Formin-like protein n=1 Tax=Mesocestoides corti TaxID=53468 RepID=A0A5K3F2P1_MESCO
MTSEDADVWNSFIQSLDVDPDKAKGIEQLPEDQKRHLIQSYVRLCDCHYPFPSDYQDFQALCLPLCDI